MLLVVNAVLLWPKIEAPMASIRSENAPKRANLTTFGKGKSGSWDPIQSCSCRENQFDVIDEGNSIQHTTNYSHGIVDVPDRFAQYASCHEYKPSQQRCTDKWRHHNWFVSQGIPWKTHSPGLRHNSENQMHHTTAKHPSSETSNTHTSSIHTGKLLRTN